MWLTAFVIGFAGSMHCLGMCSPLVLAVTSQKPSALISRVLYNAGRIAVYALIGAVISGVGMLLPLHQVQNAVSLVLGAVLLLIGIGAIKIHPPGLTAATSRLTSRLKIMFGKYIRRKTWRATILLGALNGLLPCGLTLIALSWCTTLRGPVDGFNFMLLFGAGTLPVMLGFTSALPALLRRLNWNIQRLTTSMLILSGCVLIARVFIVHLPHIQAGSQGIIDIILCQ